MPGGSDAGEIELVSDVVQGVAVHIGARVAVLAGSGEVLELHPEDAKNPVDFKGAEHKICELLWTSAVILADGRVSPCCFDYHGWVILGDCKERTFADIWNGPEYQAFRAMVSADWRKVKLCTSMLGGCPTMKLEPSDWYVRSN